MAMQKTGLFGVDQFREPLRMLVDALELEAELNPLSRILWRQQQLQLLMTRLLVQDLVIHHPEILELPVPSPIVIVGLPRTGTTHLHNLLSRDSRLRSLPYWKRLQLQVLQWSRGGTRWMLKSPQHLEQLRPLLKVFPDVKIVQTHRDPVTVTASFCTMLAYVARMYTEHVELLEVGRY